MWPFRTTKIGELTKIELTFGSKGHQLMTIDGEVYATWINYTNWPSIGSKVKHRPYKSLGMQCTEILEVL